jgi:DhnA family fructose-bisphosphate aldolase class Ia
MIENYSNGGIYMNITTHEDQIRKWRDIIHEAKESGMATIDWCTQKAPLKVNSTIGTKKLKIMLFYMNLPQPISGIT